MKKHILLAIACLAVLGIKAQNIEVVEVKERVKGETVSCLSFSSEIGDVKLYEKEWKLLMKQYKGKAIKGSEITYVNPSIYGISSDTLVVYAFAKTTRKGIEFVAAFETRSGFINKSQYNSDYEAAKTFLYNFALNTAQKSVKETLMSQQKELKKLERELESLVSSKIKLEESIVKYEKQIEQAKNDIEKNVKEQEEKVRAIEQQKDVVGKTEKRLQEIR